MDNINNQSYILLKNDNNLGASKKIDLELFNGNIKIVKERNNSDKQQDIIKKKKIIKYKLPIPNKKKFIKKENNIPKNKYIKIDKKNISNEHTNKSIVKRKNSGIVRRTKNYQLYVSKPGKISPNNTINIEQKRIGLCNQYNSVIRSPKVNPITPNSQSQKNISNVNNNIIIRNIPNNNCSNYEVKTYQLTLKNKIFPLNFLNESMNNNTIKNINYNIKSSDFNGNNNYINNENFNYINIMSNNNQMFFNKKQSNIIERKYTSKSPSNHSHKQISPLKNRNVNNCNRCEIKIIKRNSLNSSLNNQINLKKNFPNNISFHEIVHFNSPKKTNKSINKKEKQQYINKNRKNSTIKINNNYINECKRDDNNNCNRLFHHKLIHKQSLSNLKRRHLSFDTNIPHFSTSFMANNQFLKNNLLDEYYNDSYFVGHNYSHRNSQKKYLILTRQNSKSDFNSQYIENDDNEEIPEKIHYFGEQMLNRNKNYNYEKEDTVHNIEYTNKEKVSQNINLKKRARICLRKENSQSNIIKRHHNDNNSLKPLSHTNSYNEKIIKRSPEKRNKNNTQNVKNNRYKHNIINRKRMRKLAIEREQSEEFISKINNKNNGSSKEKASYCESIIDNDSINEVIREFEEEIEESEKKNNGKNEDKTDEQKNKVIHESQSEHLICSFYSENDLNKAKDSNNNSKPKPRKKHYFKTKNIDMEKNYDFIIYPTKKK